MIDVFLYTKFLECKNTTDTKQNLLFQTVFIVSAIQRVCYRLVKLRVQLVICIEQIEFDTADIDSPHVSMDLIIHIRNIHYKRITVGISLAHDRQRLKVLSLIFCYLLAIHIERLDEVSVTVKETDSAHINIAVGCLFQIISGKHTETSGIYLKNVAQSIFHTEICHRRTCMIRLDIHIFAEFLIYTFHTTHYRTVLYNSFLAVVTETFKQENRIVFNLFKKLLIQTFPQVLCLIIPYPPYIMG